MKIANNTFVVTGGGSGLGAATAKMLVDNGATVILADINEKAGEETAAQLGATAHFVRTDVTDTDSVKGALAFAAEQEGPLRGAINCAGIAIARRTVSRRGVHDLESYARVIQINPRITIIIDPIRTILLCSTEDCHEAKYGYDRNSQDFLVYAQHVRLSS